MGAVTGGEIRQPATLTSPDEGGAADQEPSPKQPNCAEKYQRERKRMAQAFHSQKKQKPKYCSRQPLDEHRRMQEKRDRFQTQTMSRHHSQSASHQQPPRAGKKASNHRIRDVTNQV